MSSPPQIFDPFGDWSPDFSDYTFSYEDQKIYSPTGEPYDSQLISTCSQMWESGTDPNLSLKQLLESEFAASKPDVTDPTDVMPDRAFETTTDFTFFEDASFAGPILRSVQNSKTKDLTGYFILPAKYCTRIRSRANNHSIPTPLVWVASENIADSIRAKFE